MGSLFNPNDPKWIKESREILEPRGIQIPKAAGRSSYNNPPLRDLNDVYAQLLKDRIVFIRTPINDIAANYYVGMMLYLQSEDAEKDINVYINSPGSGGSFYVGLGIYDTIQWLKPDVSTVCVGTAMGVASVLMAAGTKGKRFCLPNSTMIIHQPLSGIKGQASDIEIRARELMRQRHTLFEILARHTGQTIERITEDSDRVNYLSAQQAVEYGLADEIITPEETATHA